MLPFPSFPSLYSIVTASEVWIALSGRTWDFQSELESDSASEISERGSERGCTDTTSRVISGFHLRSRRRSVVVVSRRPTRKAGPFRIHNSLDLLFSFPRLLWRRLGESDVGIAGPCPRDPRRPKKRSLCSYRCSVWVWVLVGVLVPTMPWGLFSPTPFYRPLSRHAGASSRTLVAAGANRPWLISLQEWSGALRVPLPARHPNQNASRHLLVSGLEGWDSGRAFLLPGEGLSGRRDLPLHPTTLLFQLIGRHRRRLTPRPSRSFLSLCSLDDDDRPDTPERAPYGLQGSQSRNAPLPPSIAQNQRRHLDLMAVRPCSLWDVAARQQS